MTKERKINRFFAAQILRRSEEEEDRGVTSVVFDYAGENEEEGNVGLEH